VGSFLSCSPGCDLQRKEEERRLQGEGGEEDLEEGWEYVEDGPAEIIWQGNEIIVKKPRKKIRKGTLSGTPFAIEVIIVVFLVTLHSATLLNWRVYYFSWKSWTFKKSTCKRLG